MQQIMGASHTFVHEVEFYSDDLTFLRRTAQLLVEDLQAGRGVLIVATEKHRAGLAREFRLLGCDVQAARAVGRYVCLDAGDTLAELRDGPSVNEGRMRRALGGLVAEISRRSVDPTVSILGEMVAILVAQGNREEALHLEQVWNRMAGEEGFLLRCAYPLTAFRSVESEGFYLDVCAEHTAVLSH